MEDGSSGARRVGWTRQRNHRRIGIQEKCRPDVRVDSRFRGFQRTHPEVKSSKKSVENDEFVGAVRIGPLRPVEPCRATLIRITHIHKTAEIVHHGPLKRDAARLIGRRERVPFEKVVVFSEEERNVLGMRSSEYFSEIIEVRIAAAGPGKVIRINGVCGVVGLDRPGDLVYVILSFARFEKAGLLVVKLIGVCLQHLVKGACSAQNIVHVAPRIGAGGNPQP